MGTRREYGSAPEGFRSPVEIAGHILQFLADAVRTEEPSQMDRLVVTVPASFRPAQRQGIRRAAELAGLALGPGDLLDEPLAALLDFASRHELPASTHPQRLAVFDWGGGTCDVAIFEALTDGAAGAVNVAPLAVSRYHRLGGGDVDAAIIYEVLLPQLAAQNGLGPFELTFVDKKKFAEPALRPVAEALKIGLARQVARLRGLGRLSSVAPEEVIKTQPGTHPVSLANGRTIDLVSPKLSLAQLKALLEPFFRT
jgi:molecular chaperone DnaK (HSP70)